MPSDEFHITRRASSCLGKCDRLVNHAEASAIVENSVAEAVVEAASATDSGLPPVQSSGSEQSEDAAPDSCQPVAKPSEEGEPLAGDIYSKGTATEADSFHPAASSTSATSVEASTSETAYASCRSEAQHGLPLAAYPSGVVSHTISDATEPHASGPVAFKAADVEASKGAEVGEDGGGNFKVGRAVCAPSAEADAVPVPQQDGEASLNVDWKARRYTSVINMLWLHDRGGRNAALTDQHEIECMQNDF